MHNSLKKMREKRAAGDNGFTLIELLVVVVIIGILIAIAIPVYLNYRKGAQNKSAASDVRNAISAMEQCYADNTAYPSAVSSSGTITGCTTAQVKLSSGTSIIYFPDSTNANYIIAGTSGTNGIYYCYASASGGSIKTETTVIAQYATSCPAQ